VFVFVQAANSAGWSAVSAASQTITPPSSPAAMSLPRYIVTPTTLKLSWQEPACHGADILHYNIDVGDHIESTIGSAVEHILEGLIPDTSYRSVHFFISMRRKILCHIADLVFDAITVEPECAD
jgi:hypothetical protein